MGLALICVTLVVLLSPFPITLVALRSDQLFNYRVQLLLADLPLVALIAVSAPEVVAIWRERRGAVLLWALLTGFLAVSLVVHPTALSLQTVLRMLGTVAIIATVRALGPTERRLVFGTLGAAAVVQLGWGLAQILQGAPLGVGALGEFADPLLVRGGLVTPRGTLGHGYLLAAQGLLATSVLLAEFGSRLPPAMIVVVTGLSASVGLTFSRAFLGAAGLVAATLAVAWRERWARIALPALVVVIVATGLWRADGWLERADQTFGRPRDDTATARETLARQAVELIAEHPLVGVGPGQYLPVARVPYGPDAEPVHDVPLLAAAEGGVGAGLAAVALVLLLFVRAVRGPASARLVAVALLPLFLLDQFLYSEPQGLVLAGIWFGASDALGSAIGPAAVSSAKQTGDRR